MGLPPDRPITREGWNDDARRSGQEVGKEGRRAARETHRGAGRSPGVSHFHRAARCDGHGGRGRHRRRDGIGAAGRER